MRRGEIWDIEYPLTRRENSEPYGHGPVVVVSSDAFNASAIHTVLVAVVTSNLRLARAPGNFSVPADGGSGLRDDSVINVSQVLVVDKARLVQRRGALHAADVDLLNMGLRRVLALE